ACVLRVAGTIGSREEIMRKKLVIGLGPLAVAAVLALPAAQALAAEAPSVTSFEPNFARPSGGTSVTITGERFTGATAVHFGTTPAASFTVTSGPSIPAVTPPHSEGFVEVTVTTKEGTNLFSPLFRYIAQGPPPPIKAFPKVFSNGVKATTERKPV